LNSALCSLIGFGAIVGTLVPVHLLARKMAVKLSYHHKYSDAEFDEVIGGHFIAVLLIASVIVLITILYCGSQALGQAICKWVGF